MPRHPQDYPQRSQAVGPSHAVEARALRLTQLARGGRLAKPAAAGRRAGDPLREHCPVAGVRTEGGRRGWRGADRQRKRLGQREENAAVSCKVMEAAGQRLEDSAVRT